MTVDYFSDEDDSGSTCHYAQLAVPDHDLAIPAKLDGDQTLFQDGSGNTVTPTGSSFLRLGAAPVTVSYSGGTFTMTTDTSNAPSGFDASLTLAKIVGNMDGASGDTVADAEGTSDTSKTSGHYTSDPTTRSTLLGFADDTRVRDDAESDVLYLNGAARTNSQENRRTETYRLLSKGGWWDHSDGNRISTTVGDKVEVIQGNYKLLVLGRRAASDTSDKKVTDVSGGYEQSKDYEYLSTDQVWASWEKSSRVHATKVSEGKDISYFKGSERKTIIGEFPDGTQEKPEIVSKTHAKSTETRTWATKIETYVGSADDPVTHSFALTYAHFMEDIRFGETMQDVRFFGQHLTARTAGIVMSWNAGLNITTFNAAPVVWKIDLAPITFETKMGDGFAISTSKKNIHLHKLEVVPKVDELAVAKTELRAYASEVAATAIRLYSTNTELAADVKKLSMLSTSFATAHFFM